MYKHILLPVDLEAEESWAHALPEALSIASLSGAELTVMSVVPELSTIVAQAAKFAPFTDAGPKSWQSASSRWSERSSRRSSPSTCRPGSRRQPSCGRDRSTKEILGVAKARRCDLIIVGSHRTVGSHRPELQDYLMGPNAAKVVRHANCSVLVIRK